MRRRLIVFHRFDRAFGPRSRRAAVLAEALADRWLVERMTGFTEGATVVGPPYDPNPLVRRLHTVLRRLRQEVLVDKFELWSRGYFRRWNPDADLALLIGLPVSPLFAASRRLAARGIPYVVDLGDPIVASPSPVGGMPVRGLARRRALAAERRMWRSAAGGIVTSEAFAATLSARFPALPILVRPNGYERRRTDPRPHAPRNSRVLRLAHFGSLYYPRIDLRPFLRALTSSGIWDEVVFDQYGWVSTQTDLGVDGVVLGISSERPWGEVVELACDYDAAVVVGNRSLLGPPSKVFTYMTLPVPRIAVVDDGERDETARYLRAHEPWLVVESRDPRLPEKVAAHVTRSWSTDELSPPAGDSWESVAATVGEFLERIVRRGDHG